MQQMCCTFQGVSLGSLGVGCYGLKVCSPIHIQKLWFTAVVLRDEAFGGDLGHAGESARRLVSLQKDTLRDCSHLTPHHEGHKMQSSASQGEASPELNSAPEALWSYLRRVSVVEGVRDRSLCPSLVSVLQLLSAVRHSRTKPQPLLFI